MERMSEHVWCLNGHDPRFFLVAGEEKALVVDTGYGEDDIRALAAQVTDKPLVLVNTHRHLDHVSGNGQFDQVYAHPAEFNEISVFNPNLLPVQEGFVFDLGGVHAEVIETPGHTPGAVSLLVAEDRVLLAGDNVADTPIYMQNPYSDPGVLAASLRKLQALRARYDTILCCHGTCPIPFEYLEKVRKLCILVHIGALHGERMTKNFRRGRMTVRLCAHDGVSCYRPDRPGRG